MRKFFLFVVIICSSYQCVWAQLSHADSIRARVDSMHNDSVKKGLIPKSALSPKTVAGFDTILVKKGDSVKILVDTLKNKPQNCSCCIPHAKTELGFWEWILILLPFIVFLLIFFMIGKPKDFSFKDALSENEQAKTTIQNPVYDAANLTAMATVPNLPIILPPTIEITTVPGVYRPSISRYIALITSMLTLVVALSMSSFFIYNYISYGCPPDLGALSTVLIALGFGMAPYAVNKVSTALKGKQE